VKKTALDSETFIHWARVPQCRFIRAKLCQPKSRRPSRWEIVDAECLGWSLNCYGDPVRLFYTRLDIPDDGFREMTADPSNLEAEVGKFVRIREPLGVPDPFHTSPDLMAEELRAREEVSGYWRQWHERRANQKQMAALKEAQSNELRIVVAPPVVVTPKRGFLARLLGSK
jgi:hypothetical protein